MDIQLKRLHKCFLIYIVISFLFQGHYLAQDAKLPCCDERESQFDFWLGEWNLKWVDIEENNQTCENVITKVLDG